MKIKDWYLDDIKGVTSLILCTREDGSVTEECFITIAPKELIERADKRLT